MKISSEMKEIGEKHVNVMVTIVCPMVEDGLNRVVYMVEDGLNRVVYSFN